MIRLQLFRGAVRAAPLAVLIAATACADDPTAVERPGVWPEVAWAGGDVVVRSTELRGATDPAIFADTIELQLIAAAGDSAVVRVPGHARGGYTLRLGSRHGAGLGSVRVLGYAGRRLIHPWIGTHLLVWPEHTSASIIGGAHGNIYHLAPGTGVVRTLLTGYWGGVEAARLPGRTPDPEVLLLQPADGSPAEKWRVLPQLQQLGTVPAVNQRHLAQLSDSVLLFGYHHRVETHRVRGSALELRYVAAYEETSEVVISPTGDRASIIVNGSPTGPPVFDTQSGDTAYHVRQLFRSYGLAFSTDGDTLWMLGVDDRLESKLVVLDARSGEEREQAALSDYDAISMRKDPWSPRIFITALPKGAAWGTAPFLLVVDARSLRVTGRVAFPAEVSPFSQCDYCVIAVDQTGVFVVDPGGYHGQATVYSFDYPDT